MSSVQRLTLAQSRRIALAAQGFGQPRPNRPVTVRDVQSQIDRLAQFQIDSVNVLARAHYLPLFSRLGSYDPQLLDRASNTAPRRLFEYWGHAASLIDVRLQPALRFKMADAAGHAWPGLTRLATERPDFVAQVLEVVKREGPLTARQFHVEEERSRDQWGWNWSSVKTALEWQFSCGAVTAACRNSAFERVYDLPERALPASVMSQPTPSPAEARRELARRAARALGVFSETCIADYFRTKLAPTRIALAQLEAAGEIEPVEIAEWPGRRWVWADARRPRQVEARALVSPFDSLIFERNRTHALFDMFYRIEIYVPQAKRQYGYYVYPFLMGESFAARVDLKADRARRRLLVQAAWREPSSRRDDAEVVAALAHELRLLGHWLELTEVEVLPRGDLAQALANGF